MTTRPLRHHVVGAWVGVAIVTTGLQGQDASRLRSRTTYEDLQMFSQVLNQIRVNHPDSIESHELIMAAIEGMVRAADPHSYVLPSVRMSPEREDSLRRGRLHPVPIEFIYHDEALVVANVNPGRTASRFDILPGDEVVAVDGAPVTARSAAELDITLSGKKGTQVALTLRRRRWDGSVVTVERSVTREEVGEETAVVARLMLDTATGYVRIAHFANDEVADDFHDALGQLKDQGMTRLILDLRDNAGGIVEQAAKVAGEFLPRGATVYTIEGRKEEIADTVTVGRSFWKREKRYPVIVLVNDGTASAAELVAGALQDHDRALIVGHPTFGKSLVMQGFPLTDGSLIVMVVGHIKTPCGRVVQRRYRDISRRDYRRAAGVIQDTTRLPSCRTSGGRTVYGGGGVYPDIVLPLPEPEPLWVSQIEERQLLIRWIGGFVSDSMAARGATHNPASEWKLPPDVVQNFTIFARGEGVDVPSDATTNAILENAILGQLAWLRGGATAYYSMFAQRSRFVSIALDQFHLAPLLINN